MRSPTAKAPNLSTWDNFVLFYTLKSGVILGFNYLVSEVSIFLSLIEGCDTVYCDTF